MFSFVTNIYNKNTKGPTLMELFTATGKLIFFTTRGVRCVDQGDTARIDTIFTFLPHTGQYGCIDILYCCNDPCQYTARSRGNDGTYYYVPPLPRDFAVFLARIIAAVKNIDAPMLTRVGQEFEYRIDTCRVTRGAPV
jgi:hypothetical protein